MEITWAGLIIIPVTIPLLLSNRLDIILMLTIFFLPFDAIALVNVYNIPPVFGIGLCRYFTVFLVLFIIFSASIHKFEGPQLPSKIKLFYSLSLLAILISWFAPINFNNIKIWKYEPYLHYFFQERLEFSSQNITWTVQFLLSGIFFASLYKTMSFLLPTKIAQVIILSLFTLCFSAFLDFIPGIPDIWDILKNNISYSHARGVIRGFVEEPRISGLAIESSHLVMYALLGSAIMSAFYKNNLYVFNKQIDFFMVIIFLIVGIFSFSPTFLTGYSLIILYLIWNNKNKESIYRALIYIVISLMIIFVVSHWVIHKNLFEVLIKTALVKMGLAEEYGRHSSVRYFDICRSLDAFLKSPIIGIGWGSFNANLGFPLFLLASVGIIGTLIFLSLIILIFILAKRKLTHYHSLQEKTLREGFMLGFLIITAMCLYTKGDSYFLILPLVFIPAAMCSDYGLEK